jgi:hypothetical protein
MAKLRNEKLECLQRNVDPFMALQDFNTSEYLASAKLPVTREQLMQN